MRKNAVLVAILAFCFAGCATEVSNTDDGVNCEYNGKNFTCQKGESCGEGVCIKQDQALCGDAQVKCGAFEQCVDGECRCKTGGSWDVCSGTCCQDGCVDLMENPSDCGACGKVCKTGEVCVAGKCEVKCSEEQTECTENNVRVCKNLQSDANNCGACGNVCQRNDGTLHIATTYCDKGQCGITWEEGWSDGADNLKNGCELQIVAKCGNDLLEPSEVCDGTHLNDQTCETIVGEGSTGMLRCSDNCFQFLTDGCSAPKICGNGRIDAGEKCDGEELGSSTCESILGNGISGKLGCLPDCSGFDFRMCKKPDTCGNKIVDAGEVCDGSVPENETCSTVVGNGSKGTLGCAENCLSYDVSNCSNAYKCGNGILEPGEECDGVKFGNATCASKVGFGSMGMLSCDYDCRIDTKNCSAASTCGNGKLDGSEICDGKELNQKTCEIVVGKGSKGELGCTSNCSQYDISKCSAPTACNNSILEDGEVCDGSNLNNMTCADIVGIGSTGKLTCNSTCTGFNKTGCTPRKNCGNGKLDSGEVCDGTLLNGAECANTVGKESVGKVLCSDDCLALDLSNCSAPELCGNGMLDLAVGEVCDGANLNAETCESIVGKGSTGKLACGNGCRHFDRTGCSPSQYCGDGKIQSGEICDMTNLAGRKCSDNSILGEGAYGTLRCNSTCDGLDTSDCRAKAPSGSTSVCGNGVLEEGEACDKNDFGHKTCKSELKTSTATGSLTCSSDCKSIITTGCEFCGDNKLKEDASEDCDGVDWRVQSCEEYEPKLYSGGTLRCNQETCEFDVKDCILKSVAYACENEGETRCSGNKLEMCMDNLWEEVYVCGDGETSYPYCSAQHSDCLPTSWCNIQYVGKNSSGKWEGYGRFRPMTGFGNPEAYMICTQDINKPLNEWDSVDMQIAEKNASCTDCGENIEYGTIDEFNMPAGTSYCTFVFLFGSNEYACLPIKNGVSEPIPLMSNTKLTPESSYVVHN